MKLKKLFTTALAAGLCVMATATPVKANVNDADGNSVNQATFVIGDFYDSDKEITEVKSFTVVLGCDTALSVSDAFNGQVVIQNTVDWAWNQKSFSADASVNDWQGNPYNYALNIIDESTAELTVPCEDGMALLTLEDKLVIGDWNAYNWTVKEVKFNFGEEETTDTPAAELPKTGLVSGLAFVALGSALVAAGAAVRGKKED